MRSLSSALLRICRMDGTQHPKEYQREETNRRDNICMLSPKRKKDFQSKGKKIRCKITEQAVLSGEQVRCSKYTLETTLSCQEVYFLEFIFVFKPKDPSHILERSNKSANLLMWQMWTLI